MLEARAIWTDKERFLGEASSGHAVVVDAGADKTASSPVELVLIALCACTSVDVVGILRKKREPFTSLEVCARAERSEDYPRVFTSIRLIYRVGGKVTRKAMEDAVRLSKDKYCSVSAMLQTSAKIEFEIEYGETHEHEKLPDQK
jgi:putative redox protein